MKFCVFLVVLLYLMSNVKSAKILAIFPLAAPSHYFLGNSLLKGLAQRGHDVTMISPFIEKNPAKNGSYRDIVLTGFTESHQQLLNKMDPFEIGNQNFLSLLPFIGKMMTELSENTLNHTNVQKLLKSDEKFDVVIVENFMNEAHKAFAHHYKAPLILLSTIGANTWVNLLVGNPAPPSYVPETFLNFSSNMTFIQRVINGLVNLFNHCFHHFYTYPVQYELARKYFPDPPTMDDMLYNISIVLLNSHPSLNQPVPYVPNMIDIGGYHVQPPKKLPKDLQEFLDNAKDGVIYFSLGSNIKSVNMPAEKRQALLDTFSKLKQQVLWKWEDDVLPGQPSNVKLGKWLPQQDILAHPNVKLFISHGGLLSTIETIYHGVPVLSLPIGADQKLNAERSVNQGFALMISFKDLSEKKLTEKINELLTNPKYQKAARIRSQIFHDRQVGPMDTAIYWVEYVIRHKGAPHLRVAGVDLPWYQYHLLDVIGFISILGLLLFYVNYRIIIVFCCKRKQPKLKMN